MQREVCYFPQDATIIEEDNQACVYASEIPHLTRGMKHLDLAEMLIKEKVESNEIELIKVASAYRYPFNIFDMYFTQMFQID